MIALAIHTATFLAGTFTGLLVLLRVATAREQRRPFSIQAQTPATAASRLVTGLYVRRPQPAAQVGHVTAQFSPGHERYPAAIASTGPRITSGTGLPEISNPASSTTEMEAQFYDRRDR